MRSEGNDADEPTRLGLSGLELARAIDRVHCGVYSRDVSGRIVYANERLHEWLGYELGRLVGRRVTELVPSEVRDLVAIEMDAVEQGDERARLNVLMRQDGTAFPVIVLPHPIFGDDDSYEGSIVVLVELATVQAAKPVAMAAQTEVRSTLARIALELQSISLTTGLQAPGQVPLHHPDLSGLSPREREVLGQLMGGYRVPAIAEQLEISQHTVRNHLKSIYRKAGVQSQAELIQWVRGLGE